MSMTTQKNRPKSGLRTLYRVELGDGKTVDVQTELSDVLRWENQHDGEAFLVQKMPIARFLWVIWRAGRRLQLWTATDPESWFEQVVDFQDVTPDGDDDPGEPDPTDRAPSA